MLAGRWPGCVANGAGGGAGCGAGRGAGGGAVGFSAAGGGAWGCGAGCANAEDGGNCAGCAGGVAAAGAPATGAACTPGAGAAITGFSSTTNSRTCLPSRVFTCSRKSRYGSLIGWVLVTRISFWPLLSVTTWNCSVWSVGVTCSPARAKSSAGANPTVRPSSSVRFSGCSGIAATRGWFNADLTWIWPNCSAHAGAAAEASNAAHATRSFKFMKQDPQRHGTRRGCPSTIPRARARVLQKPPITKRLPSVPGGSCRRRHTRGLKLVLQRGDFGIALLQLFLLRGVVLFHLRHLRLQRLVVRACRRQLGIDILHLALQMGRMPGGSGRRRRRNGHRRDGCTGAHGAKHHSPQKRLTPHVSHPAARNQMRSRISISAICTAFNAAPLRMLSDTIHRSSPFGCEMSSRMRPTYTGSLPDACPTGVG